MRVIVIDPERQEVTEADIDTSVMLFRHGFSHTYRDHRLWVDNSRFDGPAFILSDGETTLGPFHGQGFVVAQDKHGNLLDATMTLEQVHVRWSEAVREKVMNDD